MKKANINHNELWLYENPEALASVKRGLEDAKQGRVSMNIEFTPCNGGYKATDIDTDVDVWGHTKLEAAKILREVDAALSKDGDPKDYVAI